ncbi:hypothetical protein F383_28719 [Gossypium arboreum]|uniref:Uncharacterized protein n=1 Tax=Gossypium arboreum TaxID=29729 RepID=A0A0B0PA33_GOSAR|nr:hypothetical protein F383_28719 [Gossypium arboreum]
MLEPAKLTRPCWSARVRRSRPC